MPASCTSCTTIKKAEFLDLLAETGNVTVAAKACNLARRTVYFCRATDPAFAAAWEESLEIGLDALEDEAIRRAREGVEEPVFQGGLRCGSVRKYSDLLLIFLLKSRRPHRYGGAVQRDALPVPVPLTIDSDPTEPASPENAQLLSVSAITDVEPPLAKVHSHPVPRSNLPPTADYVRLRPGAPDRARSPNPTLSAQFALP